LPGGTSGGRAVGDRGRVRRAASAAGADAGRLGRLPGPQREALQTVFGISAGAAPDRFLVALAVLSLLSEVAAERPLVCVIDDQQWLDQESAQALGFAARRLAADPVGLGFAARVPGAALAGLPEMAVGGWRRPMRGRCLTRRCRGHWMRGCGIRSWRRPGGIRWRCLSCRAG
jgi:hypothetical protein